MLCADEKHIRNILTRENIRHSKFGGLSAIFLGKARDIAIEMCSRQGPKMVQEFEITRKFIRRLTVNAEWTGTFVRDSECRLTDWQLKSPF